MTGLEELGPRPVEGDGGEGGPATPDREVTATPEDGGPDGRAPAAGTSARDPDQRGPQAADQGTPADQPGRPCAGNGGNASPPQRQLHRCRASVAPDPSRQARAMKATAHGLARPVWMVLTKGQPYVERGIEAFEAERRESRTANLKRRAKALGFGRHDAETGEVHA